MTKLKSIILTALICSLILALFTFFIPHMDWVFLPYLILAGCFLTWVQSEVKSYKFLSNLLVGSLLLGFVTMLFIFLKIYLLAHFWHNDPSFLSDLIGRDSLILALVYVFLIFLGGLLGIVCKGFYSLYKGRLIWPLIISGPFLLTIASLAVFKVRAGTIMSGYYGLPYSYLTYQFKDIIDGLVIKKWIFSPGSFYHYIFFNYFIYFTIFITVFYLLKFINNHLSKKINPVYILFALLIIATMAFLSFLPAKKSYIDYKISAANYCQEDRDCVFAGSQCPFACGIALNRAEADKISSLVNSYPSFCQYQCADLLRTSCINHRCEIITSQINNWQRYESARLGYSLEYPANILTPHEGDFTEPDFVGFYADQGNEYVQVFFRKTDAEDLQAYIEQHPRILENGELTSTMVSGLPAFSQRNGSYLCPNCIDYTFWHNGLIYVLDINLPRADAERVRQSFLIL